jgi:Mor family transcriptional regulator
VVTSEILSDPDLIDRIFDYIVAEMPEMRERAQALKETARREFGGMELYIPRRSDADRQRLALLVLELFNGRNATEIARALNISRASVYRVLKQAPRSTSS